MGALRVNRQQNVKKWNMRYNTGKSGEHKHRAVDVQGPRETALQERGQLYNKGAQESQSLPEGQGR